MTTRDVIRVLVVDDQSLMRAGIRDILAANGGFRVADVGGGEEATEYLERHAVDVVLLDVRMPGWDGVQTTKRIIDRFGIARPRILILTTFEHDRTVIDAVQAGADGFIGKGIEPHELVDAVRSLAGGGAPLSPLAGEALVKHVGLTPAPRVADAATAARFAALTPRERDIVIAIAAGLTTEEVAAAEHISPYTVKTHITRAMSKVAAVDRTQLIALAFRAGMVDGI